MRLEEALKSANPYREAYAAGFARVIADRREEADRHREAWLTPEKLAADPSFYREALKRYLGWPLTEAPESLPEVTVCQEQQLEPGLRMLRLQLMTLPGLPFYGVLLLPEERTGNPLVIAQHGGGGTPEQVLDLHKPNRYRDVAVTLAKKGCAVFIPQLLLWREDAGTPIHPGYQLPHGRAQREHELRQLGGSIAAVEVFSIMRCIDWLSSLEAVDGTRVGMIGLSYGGFYTQLTAALDTRIRAAVTSSFFNDRYAYCWHDVSWFGSALSFKDPEICALIAPRALCVHLGKNDTVFSWESALQALERLKAFYGAQEAAEQLQILITEEAHTFTEEEAETAFLLKHLMR